MPSNSAKKDHTSREPKLVVFVVYDDIVLLDLVGPLQVFSHALNQQTHTNGYTCIVTSLNGGMIETNTVVSIPSEPIASLMNTKIDTLVVVGGDGANTAMNDAALIEVLQRISVQANRVCSVCSGALVLAAAGFLDGRRAVTHWDDCKKLQDDFPNVRVEKDPIYIKDETVWTSAGITAGIDMALAIVAEDLGRLAALKIARSMVTHMARSGGQSQFSPVLDRQFTDESGQFEKLHQMIGDNLHKDLTVECMAKEMNMSPRNFSRLYSKQMGLTPARAVEAIRIESARDMLESTDLTIKEIANRCGFNDEERMRRAFIRQLNIPPSGYRRGFGLKDEELLT